MFQPQIAKPVDPFGAASILMEQSLDRVMLEALEDPALRRGIPPSMLNAAVMESGMAAMNKLDEVVPFRTRQDESYLYETWAYFVAMADQTRAQLAPKQYEN